MPARPRARRRVVLVAAAVLAQTLFVSLAGAASAAGPRANDDSEVVSGELFDPASLPSGLATSARAKANHRALEKAALHRPASPGRKPATGGAGAASGASIASVAPGIGLLHTYPQLGNYDATGGMVGGKVVYGTPERVYADYHLPTDMHVWNWENPSFFAIPNNQYYFGSTVSSSIYQGRWVAAMMSFVGPGDGCTTGYMNVAVSTSTDPLKPWIRYHLSIGDAWSDSIRIGVSDNKVVLSTNRWDLDVNADTCLGSPFEGARLRVMDWSDLLDGGTLTTKDVSPSTPTNYFNLFPATNVPTASSTTSGTTLYIAGEKFASSTWGHVVLQTITGSAKSGSAVLARNEDLTASGQVPLLTSPPTSIAAFQGGSGYLDERLQSATYRSGRLWISSNASCTILADGPRACARFNLLNTSVTPATSLENAYLADVERDTFLPMVGFARDGGAYFTVAASSAIAYEPINELATFRPSGSLLVGGADEVSIWDGEQVFPFDYFGATGSIMPIPNDSGGVIAVYSATADQFLSTSWATQLRGGLTGDPGGSFAKVGNGSGFIANSYVGAILRPSSTSPIVAFRFSAAPDVESTPGGPHLIYGKDFPSKTLFSWDLSLADIGGVPDPTSVTLYVQWQTADGTWSTPISSTQQIDKVNPDASVPRVAFTTGTIGSKVPIKFSWSGTDDASGIGTWQYLQRQLEPTPSENHPVNYPATTLTLTKSLTTGSSYAYDVEVDPIDRAGNFGQESPVTFSLASVPSSTNIVYAKTWSTASSSSYLGGSTRYASSAGATVTYTFTGRAIGFVSTKGPSRGKAEIWIDDVKVTTVDLYSSTTKYRQLAYQTSWLAAGPHKIMVKVLGTSGRPRVDFDSFLKVYTPSWATAPTP